MRSSSHFTVLQYYMLNSNISFNRVKSSQELELEELEKAPKFKAKPLNKKVFITLEAYIHLTKSNHKVNIL